MFMGGLPTPNILAGKCGVIRVKTLPIFEIASVLVCLITLAILSTAADQPEAVRALTSYLGALGRKRIAELNAAQRAVLARLMMTPLET
jgi:hypothetical protein